MENKDYPAFPIDKHEGLNKREYFAIKCLQAIIGTLNNNSAYDNDYIDACTKKAIRWADSLGKELTK
jgi:hypothetical protein